MIVVDGSAAVLWFLHQEGTPAARELLRHRGRRAPDLLPFEVASALLRANRRGEMALPEVEHALVYLLPRAVTITPEPNLHVDAVDIAQRHGGALYDCAYIALARRLGCGLATADRQQARIARAAGVAVDEIAVG